MTTEQAEALRALVLSQSVGSLGTLHDAEPFVSMVPFALLPDGQGFVVQVSRLASHTKDMQADPRVSLMVMALPSPEVPPQALARVTVQAQALTLAPEASGYDAARTAYLARFPQAEPMFGFGDFSLVRLTPRAFRFVGGFAQAWSGSFESFRAALASA